VQGGVLTQPLFFDYAIGRMRKESRSEARERADKIATLIAAIGDAPRSIAFLKDGIENLTYYIRRAKKRQLDPNDHDGLIRLTGGMPIAELTQKECDYMNRAKVWRRFTGKWKGWVGTRETDVFCTTLHPREIEMLQTEVNNCNNEIWGIRQSVPHWNKELRPLRAMGDIPEDIAKRFNLTPDGHRRKVQDERKRA
jgi:hypothetical protein